MKIKMNNAVGPQVRTKKATGGKLLPALGALSLGGGLQSATQFFAHTFNYQAQPWQPFQPRLCAVVDPRMVIEMVFPLSGRNHEGGQRRHDGFHGRPAWRGGRKSRVLEFVQSERISARLGALGR
jgi:hypothetical protein